MRLRDRPMGRSTGLCLMVATATAALIARAAAESPPADLVLVDARTRNPS
jgi:hypothetical protein